MVLTKRKEGVLLQRKENSRNITLTKNEQKSLDRHLGEKI